MNPIHTSANRAASDLIASRRRGAIIIAVYIAVITGLFVMLMGAMRG